MRVIAGSARSINLIAPDEKVRPTTDRTKETLFNMISSYLPGSKVLDLFAGSGALGIEALSRGAAHCDFIDSYLESIQCIKKNLEKTKLIENANVLKYDYKEACKRLSQDNLEYDIIFLDPPYLQGLEMAALNEINTNRLLGEHGIITIESDISTNIDIEQYQGLEIFKTKEYRTNKFTFIRKKDN